MHSCLSIMQSLLKTTHSLVHQPCFVCPSAKMWLGNETMPLSILSTCTVIWLTQTHSTIMKHLPGQHVCRFSVPVTCVCSQALAIQICCFSMYRTHLWWQYISPHKCSEKFQCHHHHVSHSGRLLLWHPRSYGGEVLFRVQERSVHQSYFCSMVEYLYFQPDFH